MFELAFGTALSFPSELMLNYGDDVKLVPTSSLLLSAAYFLHRRVRVAAAYDMPLTPDTRTVSGVTVTSVLQSSAQLGVHFVPFMWDFARSSRFEAQVFLYTGVEIGGRTRVFPRVGYRLSLLQNASTGVEVFFGMSQTFRLERYALIYGLGYRF